MNKVVILSNVNVDYVINSLSKELDVVSPFGYGDIWGKLLDPMSTVNKENPSVIVILPDIEEMMEADDTPENIICEWFSNFSSVIKKEQEYFVPSVMFRSCIISENDASSELKVQALWNSALWECINNHINVHYLDIQDDIVSEGKKRVFSDKMWYMGKIPYSNKGTQVVTSCIKKAIDLLDSVPKKLLILDLDNTLWGGILGEEGYDGIVLSDDQTGAIYKKVQRIVKQMKKKGVLLAIVSKNNEIDVQKVWDSNPHMVLKRDDFASVKINWLDKVENILEIARELNIGLDSFVFIDDMKSERENVRLRLPGIVVPEFPEDIELYPDFIINVFKNHFNRIRLSDEDKGKTQQYIDNRKREEASKGLTYEDYLKSLDMEVERKVLDDSIIDRIVQLHGKTNQFNLTTQRYSRQNIEEFLKNGCEVYAYSVKDRFGDYGIVGVVIVDVDKTEIISFLMSCRVMGKLIENYIISQVEQDLCNRGIERLYAKYIPTAKNIPVKDLFDNLGYTVKRCGDGVKEYEITLQNRPERHYYVNLN